MIVRDDGTALTATQALGRMLLEPFSFLVFGVGVLMVAFRTDKRALHDVALRTRVVLKHSLPVKTATSDVDSARATPRVRFSP